MNILDKIIVRKQVEIELNKKKFPTAVLEKSAIFSRNTFSLKKSLSQKSGVIAEIKFQSPSKGVLRAIPWQYSTAIAEVQEIAQGYANAGAAAISVLTDQDYFAGKNEYLQATRETVNIPLLRKDFIIDEYQILEAKALGADLILLIAACLNPLQIKQLAQFAHTLGLEVLLEVHDLAELETSLNEYIDLLGVNNRNLKTFQVDIQTSLDLAEKIPHQFIKISESGLSNPLNINTLQQAGYRGFLIGETFMKTENPGLALRELWTGI